MRYILLISISILATTGVTNAAVGSQEVEQTTNFLATVFSFFSTEMLLKVMFAVFVVAMTFIFSKVVQVRLFGYLESTSMGDEGGKEELIGVISRTVNIIIIIVGFSITLGVLGIDLGIFMGGIGFGIGFTLKTFLTNFIAGIIMVTQGVYHSGDLIQVGDKMGRIQKINALFTAVQERDGVMFYIPNIKFIEEEIRNFHANDKRRLSIETIVEYGTDITKAKEVLRKVIGNFPNILKAPEYDVVVESLGENGVMLRLRFWIHSKDPYISIKSNVTETINLGFQQAGIVIPYKQIMVINKK